MASSGVPTVQQAGRLWQSCSTRTGSSRTPTTQLWTAWSGLSSGAEQGMKPLPALPWLSAWLWPSACAAWGGLTRQSTTSRSWQVSAAVCLKQQSTLHAAEDFTCSKQHIQMCHAGHSQVVLELNRGLAWHSDIALVTCGGVSCGKVQHAVKQQRKLQSRVLPDKQTVCTSSGSCGIVLQTRQLRSCRLGDGG